MGLESEMITDFGIRILDLDGLNQIIASNNANPKSTVHRSKFIKRAVNQLTALFISQSGIKCFLGAIFEE